jgi:hypothetical protein
MQRCVSGVGHKHLMDRHTLRAGFIIRPPFTTLKQAAVHGANLKPIRQARSPNGVRTTHKPKRERDTDDFSVRVLSPDGSGI